MRVCVEPPGRDHRRHETLAAVVTTTHCYLVVNLKRLNDLDLLGPQVDAQSLMGPANRVVTQERCPQPLPRGLQWEGHELFGLTDHVLNCLATLRVRWCCRAPPALRARRSCRWGQGQRLWQSESSLGRATHRAAWPTQSRPAQCRP